MKTIENLRGHGLTYKNKIKIYPPTHFAQLHKVFFVVALGNCVIANLHGCHTSFVLSSFLEAAQKIVLISLKS